MALFKFSLVLGPRGLCLCCFPLALRRARARIRKEPLLCKANAKGKSKGPRGKKNKIYSSPLLCITPGERAFMLTVR